MKRISKRVREEAAMLCAIAASSQDPDDIFTEPCEAIGVDCYEDGGSADLARVALWKAGKQFALRHDSREWWAEAEAMLRTGWTPEHWS